uniref:Uncharacterized protein n=1 Tax=Triticum urartu TaxID=4572 RepID=A0A8R7P7I4_TRIUA
MKEMYSASAAKESTEQHLNQPTGAGAGAERRVAQSAAAARDGGAAAGVGVGLAAGAAVVVGGAAHGAGHVVPPQRAVADVPVAALQHAPRRHRLVAAGAREAEPVVGDVLHAQLPAQRHLRGPGLGAAGEQEGGGGEEEERRREGGGLGCHGEGGESGECSACFLGCGCGV